LEGEAAEYLSFVDININTYNHVLQLLKTYYGDKEASARDLQLKLQNLEAAKGAVGVKKLYRQLEALIRQLESLKEPIASEETILEVEKKLPFGYIRRLQAEKKFVLKQPAPNNIWDLTRFRAALCEFVIDDERLNTLMEQTQGTTSNNHVGKFRNYKPSSPSNNSKNFSPTSNDNKTFYNKPTINMIATNANAIEPKQVHFANQGKRTSEFACVFCSGLHRNSQCQNYNTSETRGYRIRELKRCLQCLRSNHWVRDCTANYTCNICNQKGHHILLCRQEKVPSFAQPSINEATNSVGLNTITKNCLNATGNANAGIDFKTYMMTVEVQVINPKNPSKIETTRAFIDTGCSETYITTSLVERLGLIPENKEKLTILWMGDIKGNLLESNGYKFTVYTND
jgi:hypothetical protein